MTSEDQRLAQQPLTSHTSHLTPHTSHLTPALRFDVCAWKRRGEHPGRAGDLQLEASLPLPLPLSLPLPRPRPRPPPFCCSTGAIIHITLVTSSFLSFLQRPPRSRTTASVPDLFVHPLRSVGPKPPSPSQSRSQSICVRSLLAPVSSSNRRVVASVSGLGLGKKQREQRPPQSTLLHLPNLRYNPIASTTEQLRYHLSARRPAHRQCCPRSAGRAACLPAPAHLTALGELSSVWRIPYPSLISISNVSQLD